jgi:hypothetical protein
VVNVCRRVNRTDSEVLLETETYFSLSADSDRSSERGVTGPENRGRVMSLKLCSSTNETEFAAEIVIHFSVSSRGTETTGADLSRASQENRF